MRPSVDGAALAAGGEADVGGVCPPARRIFERLLQGFDTPAAVRLWNDAVHVPGRQPPAFTLVLHDPAVLRQLILHGNPLQLAEAYVRGRVDVEGDLYSALGLKRHLLSMRLPWHDKLALWREARRLPSPFAQDTASRGAGRRLARRFSARHSRRSDRAAVSFHYDLSNEFYQLWLDERMVYSCAYFERPDDSLEQAQCNKLEHICRKLRLQPGDRFLDIGCGWGALVCWAAREHGVRAHGITLSRRQLEHAQQRIGAEGLQGRVTVELRDYRDLPPDAVYDKVASVGMVEHVGTAKLPLYFASVSRVLRPGGLFLNHGITHDEEGWHRNVTTEFLNRHVFPDGELDSLGNLLRAVERGGFEIHDVEGLRPHYAMTLRHWVARLEAQRERALRLVDDATYRVWRLYMAGSALEFESGGTGIYQTLVSRRHGGEWPVPLTRRDLYALPDGGRPRAGP